ncbi:DUF2520 domain-containing protein [Pontibacter sp. Tf4]|uniref:Rossmann-like and DUF2520 domain-containing protein n=1 Tax=Pontibacter sp. Tf4 TaxID=2761620 RepID=UPI0016237B6A|nr:Rossmann-like and DUF2520 domain-containing protein [Pontibacter sp. Tf4]MBB6611484.1 DUF2520 domain-containing protein [Pontibacter sp. Tf4]
MAQHKIRPMNITIVGAGNVAWHLAPALQAAGHKITAIYSRTLAHAKELSRRLSDTLATQSLDFTTIATDVVLIAVPDAVIVAVANELKVKPGAILAHTSGSQPLTVLQTIAGERAGVFYPLQTFSKQKPVDLQQVPVLVEGVMEETTKVLEELAQSISRQVARVDSEKRKQLHLAAVFACNFTNHLLGISHELLQHAGLPINLLQPLVQETIEKATAHHPFTVQTGPAIRHDQNVIEEHLRLLQTEPELQQLYRLLTDSIQHRSKKG